MNGRIEHITEPFLTGIQVGFDSLTVKKKSYLFTFLLMGAANPLTKRNYP